MGPTIVLHADDLGMNAAVSAGIVRGFEHGLLTSTSLLANAPHAAQALAAWRQLAACQVVRALPSDTLRHGLDASRPFDLGVHLNLTQGRPLTGARYPAALLDEQGRFPGIVRLFARWQRRRAATFRAAISAELAAQIAFLVDHGVRPTHLNGHQYVELVPQVSELLPELLARFAIPVVRLAVEPALARSTLWPELRPGAWALALIKRHYARRLRRSIAGQGHASPDLFFGTAHAGRVNAQLVELFLAAAGEKEVIEIGLHPGLAKVNGSHDEINDGWLDPLAALRERELELLQSPSFAARLMARGVRLGRLSDLVPSVARRAA